MSPRMNQWVIDESDIRDTRGVVCRVVIYIGSYISSNYLVTIGVFHLIYHDILIGTEILMQFQLFSCVVEF